MKARLEESPRDWRALMEIGTIHHAHGDDGLAAQWLLAAAESQVLDGFVVQAVGVAKQAAKYDPQNVAVMRFLAEWFGKLGMGKEAAEWSLKLPFE